MYEWTAIKSRKYSVYYFSYLLIFDCDRKTGGEMSGDYAVGKFPVNIKTPARKIFVYTLKFNLPNIV